MSLLWHLWETFQSRRENICEEWERCVDGPVWWHREEQQTSKTIFCALV